MHHNPIDVDSELKVVGKNIQYISQFHINNIVKQRSIKNGELIRQFIFKTKVYVKIRHEKKPEGRPIGVINHQRLLLS